MTFSHEEVTTSPVAEYLGSTIHTLASMHFLPAMVKDRQYSVHIIIILRIRVHTILTTFYYTVY